MRDLAGGFRQNPTMLSLGSSLKVYDPIIRPNLRLLNRALIRGETLTHAANVLILLKDRALQLLPCFPHAHGFGRSTNRFSTVGVDIALQSFNVL